LSFYLGELAEIAGAKLHGDAESVVDSVATLKDAESGSISFLSNSRYRKYLANTSASAVILTEEYLDECPVSALVCDNPYLAYARVSAFMHPLSTNKAGQHQTALVSDSASVDSSAWIGPGVVIEENASIGPNVQIGPGCVISRDVTVGADSYLVANVTLCQGVTIGKRVLIHPGAVVGSDGFGIANDDGVWVKVAQIGSVKVGDDVEIGANTTIDRGAINDTVIGDGVKLDNQIQIAHNVEIGDNTAIAACTGIAGSTKIGKQSTIGGGVVVVGHLEFADNIHFSAESLITRSFSEPGYYSGNLPAMPNKEWRKTVAHLRHLEDMVKRIKQLEKRLSEMSNDQSDS
jgi:UDP-3-O-[3-hydroxymyristoyl] glucosamine N-acyltransferase